MVSSPGLEQRSGNANDSQLEEKEKQTGPSASSTRDHSTLPSQQAPPLDGPKDAQTNNAGGDPTSAANEQEPHEQDQGEHSKDCTTNTFDSPPTARKDSATFHEWSANLNRALDEVRIRYGIYAKGWIVVLCMIAENALATFGGPVMRN